MDINNIRQKLFLTFDPNSGYTMDDFNLEMSKLTIGNPDYSKLNFELINESDNPKPEYATEESAGFDLRANLIEPITMTPQKRAIVPTGLYFNLPKGFEMQIRPRSGLAAKYGVTVLNSPGTIDSDYIGEIKVILINHGEEDFIINHGDRIAQGVISSVIGKDIINFIEVEKINKETERGSGGLGSTGKN